MTPRTYKLLLILLGAGFAAAFMVLCLPPLLKNPDIIEAAAAGFVNPYASGYALDTILCWFVLAVWIRYEAANKGFRHGWIAMLLGIVPGVATGFACYLILRLQQENIPVTAEN